MKKIMIFIIMFILSFQGISISNAFDYKKTETSVLIATLKSTINPAESEMTFKIYGVLNEYKCIEVTKIEAYKNLDLIQNIALDNIIIPSDTLINDIAKEAVLIQSNTKKCICFDDANFDGYKDIIIDNYENKVFWVWNKTKFVENMELEKIINPVLNSINKTINSEDVPYLGDSYTVRINGVYKIINNVPVLLKETKSEIDIKKALIYTTVSELINNKMKITKKYDESNHIISTDKLKLNPTSPLLTFKTYSTICEFGFERDLKCTTNKIETYNGNKLLQSIKINHDDSMSTLDYRPYFQDMNFDGNKDIMLFSSRGTHNAFYYFWLWDKKTGKYLENDELEGFPFEDFPKFDTKNKTIESYSAAASYIHYQRIFKFINEKVAIIEETEWVADSEKNVTHVTVKKLIGNKLTVIKKYDEPLTD